MFYPRSMSVVPTLVFLEPPMVPKDLVVDWIHIRNAYSRFLRIDRLPDPVQNLIEGFGTEWMEKVEYSPRIIFRFLGFLPDQTDRG